jgi:hypothetical protein
MSHDEHDLAFIHDRGYGLHADRCAPGIPALLAGHGVRASVGTSFGDRPQRLVPNAPGACPGVG